jgi:hypothetical protein
MFRAMTLIRERDVPGNGFDAGNKMIRSLALGRETETARSMDLVLGNGDDPISGLGAEKIS